jgi:hypothetical protein
VTFSLGPASLEVIAMSESPPLLVPLATQARNEAAIVYIHGFQGHPEKTWFTDLRARWKVRFAAPPFTFWAVAGASDDFVPWTSSIAPLPEPRRAVIPGDHLAIASEQLPEIFRGSGDRGGE